jgi:hypothetical protein
MTPSKKYRRVVACRAERLNPESVNSVPDNHHLIGYPYLTATQRDQHNPRSLVRGQVVEISNICGLCQSSITFDLHEHWTSCSSFLGWTNVER